MILWIEPPKNTLPCEIKRFGCRSAAWYTSAIITRSATNFKTLENESSKRLFLNRTPKLTALN
uniref:Uncharacterized protein n=1 Tax=Romanomermis culicivorax TaxID=13658 RepID=A0A915JKH3_ROMCU